MSRYVNIEDAINLFGRDSEYHADTIADMLLDLPTIEVSEDCISREWLKSFEYINKGDFNSVETIREWIDNAPSVVPTTEESSMVGEWIVADDESVLFTVYKCSRCGKVHAHSPHNYCPNCGAKMKV